MTKTVLATVGFVVIAHELCRHYIRYQALKQENEKLRRRWKECATGKPK